MEIPDGNFNDDNLGYDVIGGYTDMRAVVIGDTRPVAPTIFLLTTLLCFNNWESVGAISSP